MPSEKSIRVYVRGHLYDVASEEKIEEEGNDIPDVVDEIIELGGEFGSSKELQKAILGVLSKYKAEKVKRPELVSVSQKISYKLT